MANIVVTRNADGKITLIKRVSTWGEFGAITSFALVLSAAGIALLGWALYGPSPLFRFKGIYAGILLFGSGLFLLSVIATGGGRFARLADARGLYSTFYKSLGAIPWTEAVDFEIVPVINLGLGRSILRVKTKDSEAILRRTNARANLPYALPFATIESSARVDLEFLRRQLLEMKSQMSSIAET